MKRGLAIGGTAVAGAIAALMYQAGSYGPEFLIGATADSGLGGDTSGKSTKTIDGDTVMTHYGPVQVQISVTGTHIDAVNVLQAPTGHNISWTNHAIPILVKETIDAQSAQIASVSGVSYTSAGFVQSLQSAIAQI